MFILASCLIWIKDKIRTERGIKSAVIFLIISVFGIGWFYGRQLLNANKDWQKAGQISKKTLLTLSSNYKSFPSESSLIFVDLPVKNGLAWVFPVGLKEGILFIYRDTSLKIYRSATVKKAFDLKKNLSGPVYVFVYQDGQLKKAIK